VQRVAELAHGPAHSGFSGGSSARDATPR
jgi:hypothetical protein